GWQPVAHPENIARDMPPLLDSDRGEAREQRSCLIHEGGKIPDDKELRMAGNAQIRVDRHTSDVIKRHPKGARQRGRLDTCRPKDSAGVYRLSARHDPPLMDRCHWRILHNLDAQPLQRPLRLERERLRHERQESRYCLSQNDADVYMTY